MHGANRTASDAAFDLLALLARAEAAPILHTLLARKSLRSEELRASTRATSKATFYACLRELEEIGAVKARRLAEYPRRVSWELGVHGRSLIECISLVDHWLTATRAEVGTLPDALAAETLRGFAEAGHAGILSALARDRHHLAELAKRTRAFTVNAVDTRLKRLGRTGLARQVEAPGRGRAWGLTEAGRRGAVPYAWALRWLEVDRPFSVIPTPSDCMLALNLGLPAVDRICDDATGICEFVIVDPARSGSSTHPPAREAMQLSIVEGRLRGSSVGSSSGATSRLVGPIEAWLDAMIEGRVDELEADGANELGAEVLRALHQQLFES